MTTILAYVLYIIVSVFGFTVPSNGHVDLCQGISIDNVDHALYMPQSDSWLLHFKFDDDHTVVVVRDQCDYKAYEIGSDGIVFVEF